MHALVFGASGFIGRWVARVLVDRGASVSAAARHPEQARSVLRAWRVEAPVHEVFLEQPGSGAALVRQVAPTHVFNLAAYGVDTVQQDDAMAHRLNEAWVAELAEACAPAAGEPGPRVIHCGTAAEYGSVGGMLAESGPVAPATLYGRSKLSGTLALAGAARERGTCAVTARLFTVIGAGEREGRLFPSLLRAAAQRESVALSDGMQRRDFAFVGDVARALVDLAHAAFVPGEVVNVASGNLHTVRDFVEAVARAAGMDAALLRFGALPQRPDEMTPDGVSVARLQALCGHALTADLMDLASRAVRDARSRA